MLSGILSSAQFMVSAGGQLDSVLVEMQTDVFFTLSCLCDGDQHRKVVSPSAILSLFTLYIYIYYNNYDNN